MTYETISPLRQRMIETWQCSLNCKAARRLGPRKWKIIAPSAAIRALLTYRALMHLFRGCWRSTYVGAGHGIGAQIKRTRRPRLKPCCKANPGFRDGLRKAGLIQKSDGADSHR
jgi:hypothetical protein